MYNITSQLKKPTFQKEGHTHTSYFASWNTMTNIRVMGSLHIGAQTPKFLSLFVSYISTIVHMKADGEQGYD